MATLSSEAAASKATPRGCFIVFEGVDRCGKTTQAAKLVELLNAVPMRFPDRTTSIGTMINGYLAEGKDMDDRAVHLLFSANRWEAKARIEETLAAGKHIVCDRYAYSGVAFTGAKPGLDVAWCMAPDRGLPAPDVVLYLELSVEQAMLRGQFGAERYEKEGFQRAVGLNFKALMGKDHVVAGLGDSAEGGGAACPEGRTPWHVLDAARTVEDMHADIKAIAVAAVERAKTAPLRQLWME